MGAAKIEMRLEALLDVEIFPRRRADGRTRSKPADDEGRHLAGPSAPHRNPVVRAGRIGESRRSDTDDRVLAIEQWFDQTLPDHRRVATERLAPRPIAEDERMP